MESYVAEEIGEAMLRDDPALRAEFEKAPGAIPPSPPTPGGGSTSSTGALPTGTPPRT